MSFAKYIFPVTVLLLMVNRQASAQVTSPNLIQDEMIKVAGITTDAQILALTASQKQTTRQFFDGLGRPIQTIAMQASPSQKDIISNAAYNTLGQQLFSYLPYVGGDGSGNYHPSGATEQTSFYSNGLSDKVADDIKPWSQRIIENSPLQRILYAGMDGDGFQPNVSDPAQHYKSVNYRSNNGALYTNDTCNTGIRIWNSDGTSSATYATGSLSVTELTDEAGNLTISYKDAKGRIVLKRQMITAATVDSHVERCLDTYYIYDDMGELLYIVPPKWLAAIRNVNASPWNISIVSPVLFQYVYDAMGRLIQKRTPNSDWTYIVYDPMNRPVLIQDGSLRSSNGWFYFKYDQKGRSISYGIYKDAVNGTSYTAMQNYVNSLSASYSTYYYEEKQTGGTSPNFYTNRVFPTANQDASALQDLRYLYYDDYDLNSDGSADYSYQVQGLANEATSTSLTRGLVTSEFSRTLNNAVSLNVWLKNIPFYDKRGNLIQVITNNQVNISAADTKTSVPDFVGKVLQTKVTKTVNAATVSVSAIYGYDVADRLSTIDQSINGGSSTRVAAYIYNELGQLTGRKLHSTDLTNFFQKVDYRYNINGKLTSINNATLSVDNTNYTNDDANDLFGMNILYDKTDVALGNTSLYNGNISGVEWKASSLGNSNERSYIYSFDQLNRLSTAHYSEWNATSNNWTTSVGYNDENINKYDLNGNIELLSRYSNGTLIDSLRCSISGNMPGIITDFAGLNRSLGYNAGPGGYLYDNNGNLLHYPSIGYSTNLSYNVLNRADKIIISNPTGDSIRYTYDAKGTVIRKEVFITGTLSNTYDYIDGFIYQNGTLSYFPTSEGRVRYDGSSFVFEYYIRDYLGNVRVSFDGTGTTASTRQENSYYPFGMILPGNVVPSGANKNLFNGGSEWQNDFGNMPGYYQSGVRNYDAALGRFIGVDPLAEENSSLSPFQYAGNNPVMANDPTGMKQIPYNGGMVAGPGTNEFAGIYAMADAALENDWNSIGWGGGGGGGGGGDYSAFWNAFLSSVYPKLDATAEQTGEAKAMFSSVEGGPSQIRVDYGYLMDDGSGSTLNSYVGGVSLFNSTSFDGGNISPSSFKFRTMWSGSNQMEAGVSGLYLQVVIPQLFGASPYVREFDFNTIYVQFPKKTWFGVKYDESQAAIMTARGMQWAISEVASKMQTMFANQIANLSDNQVQRMFTESATFFISAETIFSRAYVTTGSFGRNTIVSPAIWGP